MAVPDYQSLMLPILKIASDRSEHTLGEVSEKLALEFKLSDDDRKELLPTGLQARFGNRVGWARTYLKKAGLLESAGRGRIRITERGLDLLKGKPVQVDTKVLRKYPEFVEFQKATRSSSKSEEVEVTDQTPEELLEASYQGLRRGLAQELLERIRNCSPKFFEKLVVDLLLSMGYGGSRKDAGQAVGQTGDGGVDGVIKEDKLGLDVVYIQAKRWEATVGRPSVQGFAGSLEGFRARKGVMITTSKFTEDAKDYANRIEKKIVLIEGEQLAQLMIDHGIGVTEEAAYVVKKIDTDYFDEDE